MEFQELDRELCPRSAFFLFWADLVLKLYETALGLRFPKKLPGMAKTGPGQGQNSTFFLVLGCFSTEAILSWAQLP